MLEAIFSEGITTVTVTGLTQWDYGRKLTIKGLSYTDNVEVHFSNNIEKEAVVMEVTKSGSDLVTEVPNVLLEKNHDITAWVYIDSGTSGETVRTINLKVKPRIKPADYISENNAGKVIDYVAKAEEYASSAQESAEIAQDNAEKVQANTDLVQDILANVPDFDSYEKLAEHNKLLYDGLYVKGETYSGIASNKGIKLHKVVGKTEQKTTNGYQLFDASKLPTKTIGGATLTNNGDGSFTISGSGNLSANFNYYYYMGGNPLKVGRLTLKLNGPNSIVPLMQVIGLNKLGDGSNQNRVWDIVNETSIDITQELLEQTKDIYIVFYGSQGKEIKPGTIKPMLYQDGDGTWEPYTGAKPAPNGDYPMEIKNVEISEITSHGRNLLPYPYYCGGIGIKNTQSGIDFEILPDKSFKLSGTATSACYINLSRIEYGDENFSSQNYIGLVGNTNECITLSYNPNNKITSIYVAPNRAIDTIVYPMVSKGKQVPEWEAPTGYNTTSTNLTLAQDDIYQQGTITRARKQVTFDGSSDEGWVLNKDWTGNSEKYDYFYTIINDIKSNLPFFVANRFKCITDKIIFTNYEEEAVYKDSVSTKSVYVSILKSRLSSNDVDGFKKWLQSHPIEFEYELETPTTEEFKVPTIPSYYPFTNVSTDCNLETEIQYEILANSDNSLKQEELEKRIEALEHAMLER